jgi:hypothetical protein
MATSGERPAQPDWLVTLGQSPRPVAYALFGLAAVFLLITLYSGYKPGYRLTTPAVEALRAGKTIPDPTLNKLDRLTGRYFNTEKDFADELDKTLSADEVRDHKGVIERQAASTWSFDYPEVAAWGLTLALVALGGGLWQLSRETRPEETARNADAARYLLLVEGGVAGLATFVLGAFLTYHWWASAFAGEGTGPTGLALWRKEWVSIALSQLALIGGLTLIFVTVQVARGQERTNPTLRLLLYGYNAVLSGLLLLYVLAMVNLLSYSRLPGFNLFESSVNWSSSNLYSLSPANKSTLHGLTRPVTVYVLLTDQNAYLKRDVEVLLGNCRAAAPAGMFDVDHVSPYLEPKRFKELGTKYKVPDLEGLLLVYKGDKAELNEFVSVEEMTQGTSDFARGERGRERVEFQGEHALFTKLNFLLQGKSKAVVYFTQGNGEPDLAAAFGAPKRQGALRLGTLKSSLEDRNYEVKELRLDAAVTKVPEDASAVVIIRPTNVFPESALRVLREYMEPAGGGDKKKGKLVVLLGVDVTPEGTMRQTGLEKFLAEYNVRVNDDRVLTTAVYRTLGGILKQPTWPSAQANAQAKNPLAVAFANAGLEAFFPDARTVEGTQPPPNPHGGPAPSKYQVESLLVCRTPGTWAETNLRTDADALANDYRTREGAAKLREKLKGELSIAATVTEGGPEQTEGTPRLVVFGDTAWVDDQMIQQPLLRDLFASSLEWLRERARIGKSDDLKALTEFSVDPAKESQWHLLWVAALMLIGIVGLGGGIWLVRRR